MHSAKNSCSDRVQINLRITSGRFSTLWTLCHWKIWLSRLNFHMVRFRKRLQMKEIMLPKLGLLSNWKCKKRMKEGAELHSVLVYEKYTFFYRREGRLKKSLLCHLSFRSGKQRNSSSHACVGLSTVYVLLKCGKRSTAMITRSILVFLSYHPIFHKK